MIKNITKLSIFFGIFLFILWGVSFVLQWQNPEVNAQTDKSMHSCIYNNNDYISTALSSMDTKFGVSVVENAGKDCFNPTFPIIHIKTQQEHNAWLQIVRTDCSDKKLQEFIDASVEVQYPFYTLQQDFYDAPLWRYTLFYKPVSYWKGHAYAVKVDHDKKTIKVIGGIEWVRWYPLSRQIF